MFYKNRRLTKNRVLIKKSFGGFIHFRRSDRYNDYIFIMQSAYEN